MRTLSPRILLLKLELEQFSTWIFGSNTGNRSKYLQFLPPLGEEITCCDRRLLWNPGQRQGLCGIQTSVNTLGLKLVPSHGGSPNGWVHQEPRSHPLLSCQICFRHGKIRFGFSMADSAAVPQIAPLAKYKLVFLGDQVSSWRAWLCRKGRDSGHASMPF